MMYFEYVFSPTRGYTPGFGDTPLKVNEDFIEELILMLQELALLVFNDPLYKI